MQIRLNKKIFLLILLFVITEQIEIYALLMFLAIVHELGHLLAGVILGFSPRSFTILPFGATIGFRISNNDYNKKIKNASILSIKKLIIALAGPITNLIIVFISVIFELEPFGISNNMIIYSNILIIVFNLLPIYPLDGGRIIKNVLHIIYGLKKSYTYTNKISNATIIILTAIASIAILYLKNISILVILVYLWWIAILENKRYKNKMKIYELIENKNTIKNETYKTKLTI